MYKTNKRYFFSLLLVASALTCKKPFTPPAITASNNYLVVDGVINTGANAVTTINLNRTRNLVDTIVSGIPELNAQVTIVSANGTTYPLADTASKGLYSTPPLNLDITQQYRIAIISAGSMWKPGHMMRSFKLHGVLVMA